ncbi:MAG: bifunctional pyr operon transcriptional regulator/uracil phosphoribosyltransferase PyrR [Bacteroidota bacterium]
MQKKLILDSQYLAITTQRLCHQLIENHGDFNKSALLGLQPRGIFFAERIKEGLEQILDKKILLGYLDITFYRDDFRRADKPLKPNTTKIDFLIENQQVIIIDDVLYTGRTVRAAMDAMMAFGRPNKVELLTLIDRKYTRNLPVQADYVGKAVNTLDSQRIRVELTEQGFEEDNIWLTYE